MAAIDVRPPGPAAVTKLKRPDTLV